MTEVAKNPFDVYWARLCRSNPKLEKTETMTLSVLSFRKAVAKAFRAGQEDVQKRTAASKDFEKLGIPKPDFNGIFDGIF